MPLAGSPFFVNASKWYGSYYPFGLTMQGISSKAANSLENKKKYNGIELDNDLDINTYEAFFRDLDPQIARWWQIDPKTDGYENLSPYASMYDDPLKYSDPLGDEAEDCCWDEIKAVGHYVAGAAVGTVVGVIDNVTGGNLRGVVSPSFAGTGAAAHGWNMGLDAADAGSLVLGVIETTAGIGAAGTGGTTTVLSGGVLSPVSVPLTVAGVTVAAHGVMTTVNSYNNMVNQTGRVNAGETTHQTYTKPAKDGSAPYAGRTSGPGTPEQNIAKRDAGHHMNETHGPAELDKSSKSKDAIRGREQQLINANGGSKSSGGTSGNQINGISDKNKKKQTYMEAAEKAGYYL